MDCKYIEQFPFDFSWLIWRDVIVWLSHGMEQCLMTVWSLYTSLNFFEMKYQMIGVNGAISTGFSILTHLLFGRFIDKVIHLIQQQHISFSFSLLRVSFLLYAYISSPSASLSLYALALLYT